MFRVWAPHADVGRGRRHVQRLGRRARTRWPATTTARPRPGRPTSPGADPATSTVRPSRPRPATCNRIDPRARRLTNSVGNGVDLRRRRLRLGRRRVPPAAVERPRRSTSSTSGRSAQGMHGRPGTLDGVRRRLRYLRELGVGAIQLMPPFEFAGDRSWGYNPAYPFAVESDLRLAGRPQGARPRRPRRRDRRLPRRRLQPPRAVRSRPLAVRRLVRERQGRDLLLRGRAVDDAVGRHAARLRPVGGPGVPPRQRDPVARGVPGRRPALGRDLLHLEHLRRRERRAGPDRGRLAVHGRRQRRDRRALSGPPDDRRGHAGPTSAITRPAAEGGAGFGAQWDGGVRPLRAGGPRREPTTPTATSRPSPGAIDPVDPADAFKRVIYTESHDEDANGSSRVPEEIWPGYADSWASKKRATLGSAIVLTSPGHPDAVPGPGARRGLVVQRRGRPRLDASATATPGCSGSIAT